MSATQVLEVEGLRKDFDGGRGRVVRAVDEVSHTQSLLSAAPVPDPEPPRVAGSATAA